MRRDGLVPKTKGGEVPGGENAEVVPVPPTVELAERDAGEVAELVAAEDEEALGRP